MKKLSVEEYGKHIGVSTKTVYRRIDRGQVITCKDIVNNKEVTRVIVDDDEILNSDMTNTRQGTLTDDDMTPSYNTNVIDVPVTNTVQNDNYFELIKQMYEDNKHLSELAGQAKLLTDSEHKTKEEYFKLQQENRQLRDEQVALKLKLEQLQVNFKKSEEENTQQKELEMLKKKLSEVERQKTFWDVLFKKV